jgi:uncharacterized protein
MNLDRKGLGFPLRLGPDRGLDVVGLEEDVRAMLEQILFTLPGERLNRPTFGVGVQKYVFEPNSPLLADRLRVALDENVYEHLSKDVRILDVSVTADQRNEERLIVRVSFEIVGRASGPQDLEVIVRSAGVP